MDDLISRQAAIEAMTADNLNRNLDSVHDDDMKRAARAAQRALARIPAAQRWIPVMEPPEKKNRHYLAYLDDDSMCVAYWAEGMTFGKRTGEWTWFVPNWKEVTHWMPLPEPPKEEA